ncbi:OadG family protein [Terrisporobacter glycolicus]|uniref:OadG family protein n=1 Tax=Terrisporobacter glycolicus TaxID=36841 RepID=UPI000AE9F41F
MSISQLLEALKVDAASMPMSERLLAGCATALLSMGVVFIVLVLIALIIRIVNVAPEDKKNKMMQIKTDENKEVLEESNLDSNDDLIAVITAAIIASGNKNIIVKRIIRTNNIQSNWEKTHNIEV